MSRWYELTGFVAVAVFGIAVAVVLSHGHPSSYSFMPKCPFHLLTGLHCPGCGTTRALFYLVHGDIATAFRYQPLFMAMMPIILLLVGRRLYELFCNVSVPLPFELQLYRLIAIAVCVYFVLRNVPLDYFDWLCPPS
ncbi:membrane protein [Planctomycetales bacterium]|nr:membrane protein [Planctomycetales bacterium]